MAVSAGGKMKLYVDPGSPFTRSVIIFCRCNKIEAEEIFVSVLKGECRTPEYIEINPMNKVPFIIADGFKLGESTAILRYLASTRNVPNHWFPPHDPKIRATIDSIIDWATLNITPNWGMLIIHRVLAKLPGIPKGIFPAPEANLEENGERMLKLALDQLETVLLPGPGKFLGGLEDVSIADLSVVCGLQQLQLLNNEDYKDLILSRKKLHTWMDVVADATGPCFTEVHADIWAIAKQLQDGREKADHQNRLCQPVL